MLEDAVLLMVVKAQERGPICRERERQGERWQVQF